MESYYCHKCKKITSENFCSDCGRKCPVAEGHDPVLLVEISAAEALFVLPLLEEKKIPHSAVGVMGSAFVMRAGNLLERYRVYVPFYAFEEALELLKGLTLDEA